MTGPRLDGIVDGPCALVLAAVPVVGLIAGSAVDPTVTLLAEAGARA